jgi:hypothetical protein
MLDRRTNNHIGTGSPRKSTLYQQQIVCDIHLNNFETLSRYTGITHMTSHLLAFPDSTGRLTLADRTRDTVRSRVAVSGILHVEIVTLDSSLKTFTFRGTGNIHHLAGSKALNRQLCASSDLGEL